MPDRYKQVIIVRKDLNMSPGKLAVQVSHASSAFLLHLIKEGVINEESFYHVEFDIDKGIYDGWIDDIFTKVVCCAKNKNKLMKATEWAENHNMKEGEDFFIIKDSCLTELTPEEVDKNGIGKTVTCIGFKPLPDDLANEISHKFPLY